MSSVADLPPPPNPTGGLAMLRESLTFARDPILFFIRQYEQNGPAFRLKAFDFDVTVMIGAAANRAVFVEHADKLSSRRGYDVLLPIIDDALPVSDGARHARQRRLIQPAFHSKRIEGYVDIMRSMAARAVAGWRDGDVVDVYTAARRMTLDTVVRALAGLDLGPQHDAVSASLTDAFDYVTQPSIRKIFRFDLPFHPYGRYLRARAHLDTLLNNLIRERRAAPAGGDDVLSWLIEARDEDGSQFEDAGIRDQILFLIYAGHDTATCALAWALYECARHPEYAQRVRAERNEVLGTRPIGMNDARALPWLDAFVDETLRLHPPIWIGMRGVTEDFAFNGMRIAAGSRVLFSPGATHRLAAQFPDPDRFDPARFHGDARQRIPPFAYVPYGGGARTCIGMPFAQIELRVMLSDLLARFDFALTDQSRGRIPMHYNPTLAPARGIALRVRETHQRLGG